MSDYSTVLPEFRSISTTDTFIVVVEFCGRLILINIYSLTCNAIGTIGLTTFNKKILLAVVGIPTHPKRVINSYSLFGVAHKIDYPVSENKRTLLLGI